MNWKYKTVFLGCLALSTSILAQETPSLREGKTPGVDMTSVYETEDADDIADNDRKRGGDRGDKGGGRDNSDRKSQAKPQQQQQQNNQSRKFGKDSTFKNQQQQAKQQQQQQQQQLKQQQKQQVKQQQLNRNDGYQKGFRDGDIKKNPSLYGDQKRIDGGNKNDGKWNQNNPQGQKQKGNANRDASRKEFKKYMDQSKKKFDQEKKGDWNNKKQDDFKKSWKNQKDRDRQKARQIQDKYAKKYPNRRKWFDDDFYRRHNHSRYWNNRNYNWWRGARWNTMQVWFPWGWQQPVYYVGGGYPVYLTQDYDDNYYQDYGSGQYQGGSSAPVQNQQQYQVQNQSVQGDSQDEWLPLGVFAVGDDEDDAANSNLFVQLAVNKQGDIAGSYYDESTDDTSSIDGMVDRETQEAVWKISDDEKAPIMSTGMYNLTQDVVPVQAQYSDGTQESWTLVRINDDSQ